MKNLCWTLLLFFAGLSTNAQLPGLQWAKNIGGSRGDQVVADALGNVYTTGYFSGVADFDPGPGTFYLTADGAGADDAYISKLDANGNFVWALQIGGSSTNYGTSLAVDLSGNVYTVGYFAGTVDFDPGPGTFNITTNGQYDMFILKIDAGGNFMWAKNIGGALSDIPNAMVLDLAGNICMTGVFIGAVDFDPGAGVYNLDGGGNNDCFILKLNSNGDFIQAMQIVGNYSQGDAISVDAAGNMYVCGNYNATADLDPGAASYNVTSSSGADAFVIKLNAAGSFIWGRSFGGLGTNNCESVKADANGNVYLAGDFPFTADFDPGPSTYNLTVAGLTDAYILKLDVSGNFVWVKTFGGTAADAGNDIVLDPFSNVYITGLFQAVGDFDPGPAVFNLTATSNDIFIAKITSAGDFLWALDYGGFTLDEGLSLFCSPLGNIYTTGYFKEVVDFDPGAGMTTLNSATGETYIVMLGAGSTVPLTLLNFSGSASQAGNLLQWTTAREINTDHFDVEWSVDGSQFVKIAVQQASGNSSSTFQYQYLHRTPAVGNNYYRLKMADINGGFTSSPIVEINKMPAPVISYFPNPVTTVLQLNIMATEEELVVGQLAQPDGKLVMTKAIKIVRGNNSFIWDLSKIIAGNYFISFSNKNYQTIAVRKQ